MSDIIESDEAKPSSLGKQKPLTLKGGSEKLRQSFPHGRSKLVSVERKRKFSQYTQTTPSDTSSAQSDAKPQDQEPGEQTASRGSQIPAGLSPTGRSSSSAGSFSRAKKGAGSDPNRPRTRAIGAIGGVRQGKVGGLSGQEHKARKQALDDARKQAVDEEKKRTEEEEQNRLRVLQQSENQAEETKEEGKEESQRPSKGEEFVDSDDKPNRQLADIPTQPGLKTTAASLVGGAQEHPQAAAGEAGHSSLETVEEQEEQKEKRRGSKASAKAAPAKGRATPRQRNRKLTLVSALDEQERVRSLASFRRQQEREKKSHQELLERHEKIRREAIIPDSITVQELAGRIAERTSDVVKELVKQGVMATINQTLDADTAQLIAEAMGHSVKRVSESDVEEGLQGEEDHLEEMVARAPIVTIMGHVDHGKTSLLDALRQTNIVAGESGGITQHIGAYQVVGKEGARITFLDTPGHALFTLMRARGAQITDIVVLVVAADDGVKTQTVEAINHAKAAGAPMILAINKIDKPESDPDRVRNELLRHGVAVESMGGDVQEVEISALQKVNLDKLCEIILLQAEIMELRANPERAGEGVVVETRLDHGRGAVASLLLSRGRLRIGDIVVAGWEWGRARALVDDRGNRIKEVGPAVPVEMLGLTGTAQAGDIFTVVESEARAREISVYRQRKRRESEITPVVRSVDQMLAQSLQSGKTELVIVIKADAHGSLEAIIGAVSKLCSDDAAVRVLHGGVGGISESDVTLADASNALIVGFNVRISPKARSLAEKSGCEIRNYSIIYDLAADIQAVLEGMMAPEIRETVRGKAMILEVFPVSKGGKVAGCRIEEGGVRRSALIRVIRDDKVLHTGSLKSLRRFKDEVNEVKAGQECGLVLSDYHDFRSGDRVEIIEVEKFRRSLSV